VHLSEPDKSAPELVALSELSLDKEAYLSMGTLQFFIMEGKVFLYFPEKLWKCRYHRLSRLCIVLEYPKTNTIVDYDPRKWIFYNGNTKEAKIIHALVSL